MAQSQWQSAPLFLLPMELSFSIFIIHASSLAQNGSRQKVAYGLQSAISLGSSSADEAPESSSMGSVQQVSRLCPVHLGLSPHTWLFRRQSLVAGPSQRRGHPMHGNCVTSKRKQERRKKIRSSKRNHSITSLMPLFLTLFIFGMYVEFFQNLSLLIFHYWWMFPFNQQASLILAG